MLFSLTCGFSESDSSKIFSYLIIPVFYFEQSSLLLHILWPVSQSLQHNMVLFLGLLALFVSRGIAVFLSDFSVWNNCCQQAL